MGFQRPPLLRLRLQDIFFFLTTYSDCQRVYKSEVFTGESLTSNRHALKSSAKRARFCRSIDTLENVFEV